MQVTLVAGPGIVLWRTMTPKTSSSVKVASDPRNHFPRRAENPPEGAKAPVRCRGFCNGGPPSRWGLFPFVRTAGPGALHLINGLYNGKAEGAGVVAITGQVPMAQRGSEYHKEMDLTKVFDDVCAYQAIIDSPAQMPRMAEIAVQKALTERVVTRIELAPTSVLGES